jgi:alpha-1,3/alpha-1,6-mannosyltransferase
MEVAFIHPDLGLGGAEQLVVNLALAAKPEFKPTIFTPRFERSFEPCHNGQVQVEVHGGFLPRSLCGRFFALMAYIRTILCALFVVCFGHHY